MGITKLVTPTAGTFVSTYRPIYIKFQVSGGTGNTTISYTPIEHDGGSTTLGHTLFLDADLSSLIAGVTSWTGNFQEWLKDDITHQLNDMGTLASPKPTGFINTYGNRYTGQIYRADSEQAGGGMDVYNEVPADRYFPCNATLQHKEEQSLVPYTIGSNLSKFLTKAPYSTDLGYGTPKQYINLTEVYWLSIIMNGEPDPVEPLLLVIEEEDNAGVFVYSTIEITYAGNFSFQAIFDMAVAPINLNAATLYSGVQPVIDSDTKSYSVKLIIPAPVGVVFSNTYHFTIDKRCQDNSKRFYFVNSLGSIDSHKFCGTENMNFAIDQITYQKNLDYTVTSGADVGYTLDKSEAGRIRLATDSREIYTTYSELLHNNQRIWLTEMLESPNVWTLETDEDGEYYYCPVNILSGEFEVVNDSANLLKISFQWSYANDIISQTN